MQTKPSIFRKASLERVNSPDQLGDFIRVSNLGVWLVLGATVLLLIAGLIWCVYGTLTTTHKLVAVSEGGVVACYATEEQRAQLKPGDAVEIGGAQGVVQSVSNMPVQAGEKLNDYAVYTGGLDKESWVFPVLVEAALPDGVYLATIETEALSPLSFILN